MAKKEQGKKPARKDGERKSEASGGSQKSAKPSAAGTRGSARVSRPTRPQSAKPRTAKPNAAKSDKESKPDHTSGWKSEGAAAKKGVARPGRTQYRKLQGKTWKGKPVVEVRHTMRLNKYIANSGICSRREADNLIAQGLVEVNGKQITEMGYQVQPTDKVSYAGERITAEKPTYVLLNKPKDYSTASKDPSEMRTVMALLRKVGDVRLFSVGRLDRNTSGLILFTNDSNLAKKLTHPTNGVKKLYHVHLDSICKAAHMKAILEGVELDDGVVKADAIEYVAEGKDKKQVGIEIHSAKNRVVRRLFEHLGYKIIKLDRVVFAGLTKKDLPRGKWRNLTEQEINTLKML